MAVTERAAAVGYDGFGAVVSQLSRGLRLSSLGGRTLAPPGTFLFDSGEVARVEALPFQMASRLVQSQLGGSFFLGAS